MRGDPDPPKPRIRCATTNGVLRAARKAQALDQVALRIHEGECVSPVGLNGAGKTSSFNAVSGRVP
jgi:branched-chain amino acid transport system ATP-binding protein